MTFAIPERKTLQLTHAKGRKEMHGEALVQAIDLKFSGTFSNEVLSMFHAALPAALFTAEGPAASDNVQLEMNLPIAELGNLRFNKMRYPLKWHQDIIGATVSIYYGTGKPMVIPLCKVTDFEIEPMDGGAVAIAFRASSAADITEKILGKTAILAGDSVEITLEPPQVQQADEPRAPAAPAAQQTPESIFTGGAAGDDARAAPASDAGGWPFPNDPPAVVQ